MASSSESRQFQVAIITSSTRPQRVNPLISQYVYETLQKDSPAKLTVVDLADHSLPLFDEGVVPAAHPAADPTPHYAHEHSRKWSAVIRQYDAFIFVTPQYNWSVPASLKNALDFLFHEWVGKPAAVVTYGGRGGGKAAAHMEQILAGLRMRAVKGSVPMVMPVAQGQVCLKAGKVVDEVLAKWAEDGVEGKLKEMLARVQGQLEKPASS